MNKKKKKNNKKIPYKIAVKRNKNKDVIGSSFTKSKKKGIKILIREQEVWLRTSDSCNDNLPIK